MKVAVIGSRGFNDYEKMKSVLNNITISEIISGGAIGADSLGAKYANENSISLCVFLPDWKKYGKGAGFIRNKLIVDNSDMVVAFWDGKSKGTKNSIDYSKKINKKVIIISYENNSLS